MPDYKRGKIYAIHCLTTGRKYIGSTTKQTLAQRLSEHKSDHTKYIKGLKTYKMSSFDIIDTGNYQIELIELYSCDTKDELHAREGHYIRTLECVNRYVAGRTQKTYRKDNKEKETERYKTYRKDNKEKEIERIKQYNQENKEKVAAAKEIYRQAHKEQINANDRKRRAYQKAAKELRAISID